MRPVVARQLGRPPRRLPARSRPLPLRPAGRDGASGRMTVPGPPFPTTYYLTCPQLVAAISRLEARGGVERWTRAVEEDPALRESLDRANEEQRALRPSSRRDRRVDPQRQPEVPPRARRVRARAPGLRARRADPRRAGPPLAGFRLLHRDSDLTGNAGHAPDNVTGQTTSLTRMPIALDQTRREWELGHRRFQQEVREAPRSEAWLEELEAVTAALRRRVGQSFTLRSSQMPTRRPRSGAGRPSKRPSRLAAGHDGFRQSPTRRSISTRAAAVDYEP